MTAPEVDHATAARARVRGFVRRHEVAWELGFAGLAVLFVAIGVLPPEDYPGIFALEWVITLVFGFEFGLRLWAADSRLAYLRSHWIDAVALIPPTRGARLLRLLRLLRLVRAFAGFARALTAMGRFARHRGLVWLFVAWVGVMLVTSIALYMAENPTNEFVRSPLDALWWGITTMTTVGYGDVVPKTLEGRLAAVVLMTLGISCSPP